METGNNKYRGFSQIVNSIYNEAIENLDETQEENKKIDKQVELKPKFIYDNMDEKITLEVFIVNNSMYQIKKLSEFFDKIQRKKDYQYGNKTEFVNSRESFKDECIPFLNFVLKYAEIIKYGNENSNANYRFGATALSESKIIIDKNAIDELFEILQGQIVSFEKDLEERHIKLENKNPNIKFYLEKTGNKEYTLSANVDILKISKVIGEKYTYLLINNCLYKCDTEFEKTTMKLLKALKMNYSSQVKLSVEQLPQLFSIIIPKIKNNIEIKENIKKEVEMYMPQELTSRLYLDFDENNYLIADLQFVYDGVEFNPLEEKIKKHTSRNIIEETKSLNLLRKTGFMLDSKKLRFVLIDDEKIYEFINEELDIYIKHFEILATEKFNTKKFKQAKLSTLGVKIENNLLEIDLDSLNIDKKELVEIMEKYKLKKKYHRLKDGTFLNLEDNESIDFLGKLITGANVDYKELSSGVIRLPIYRTMYLNQLLAGLKSTKIEKNAEYNTTINNLNKNDLKHNLSVPFKLNSVLRYYQKKGFNWLKTLDNYKLGGILADDMGLGKTIQLLTLIESYKENHGTQSSIVVSPSSLSLNWESEAKKFTPDLKTLVITGSSFERKNQINSISEYDLIIISYDLLKRDIEYLREKNYKFKYIIADEAQYLKNSNTQNAISIKQLQGDTRFALTGTPMENSLSELWSIFDFIMPGYLFSHRNFRNLYEAPIVKEKDELAMKKLKMLIEPFVLRRTKKEVLQELPDKTVTVLTSSMEDEQRNIYLSYLMEARQEVKETIDINGLERSHMRILAVLTRLRQICCHPGVFLENYDGGSSKLDQCLELVREGIDSGHKILLFSGYTSIFPIIEKELKEQDIKYFKLTGATKVSERVGLVDEFNNNDDIKVFLVSLKAGGTGLNLTGADMVIHYDPWWNASAENQATDRAYRIGQKKNVQVYKLITKDSIEEKIYQMQQRKSALIDNMLDIKTSFVNKLSKEEIMELFE